MTLNTLDSNSPFGTLSSPLDGVRQGQGPELAVSGFTAPRSVPGMERKPLPHGRVGGSASVGGPAGAAPAAAG